MGKNRSAEHGGIIFGSWKLWPMDELNWQTCQLVGGKWVKRGLYHDLSAVPAAIRHAADVEARGQRGVEADELRVLAGETEAALRDVRSSLESSAGALERAAMAAGVEITAGRWRLVPHDEPQGGGRYWEVSKGRSKPFWPTTLAQAAWACAGRDMRADRQAEADVANLPDALRGRVGAMLADVRAAIREVAA